MTPEVENFPPYALDQLIGTGCGPSVVKERSPNTVLAYSCPSVGSLLCGVDAWVPTADGSHGQPMKRGGGMKEQIANF